MIPLTFLTVEWTCPNCTLEQYDPDTGQKYFVCNRCELDVDRWSMDENLVTNYDEILNAAEEMEDL